MSSVTIPRTLGATAVVLAAAALVLLTRGRPPGDEPLTVPDVGDSTLTSITTGASDAPSADATETPVAAKLRELNALSETYRNTTFLIAIRDSGFVCRELLSVYGGVNDSTTWTVTCSQMLAYTVRVTSSGALRIEPMLQHVDGIAQQPRQDFGDEPVQVLPPQELTPQQR
jgi:hypothetical protein